MMLAADQNSSGQAHIAVISSPSNCDVTVARHEPIRRIEFHPVHPRVLTLLVWRSGQKLHPHNTRSISPAPLSL
jgi:hypothetical protein